MRTRRQESCRCLLVAAVIGLAVWVLGVGGGECQPLRRALATEFVPARSPSPSLTLAEAVELALQHDPAIRVAQQFTLLQRGSLAQSSGLFDLVGLVEPSVDVATGPMSAGMRKGQLQLRDLRRQVANESDRVADGLQRQLSQGNVLPPDCDSLAAVLGDVVVKTEIGSQTVCIEARQRLELQVWRNLARNFGLTQLGQALDDAMRARTELIMDLLHSLAFAMRRQMRELGTTPERETVTNVALNLGVRKPYRSGAVLTIALLTTGTNDNFDGKPADPKYGGRGIPDAMRTSFGFELDVPLGQGGGAVSAAAAERAARLQVDASLASQAFAVATTALNTEIAYWNLVGSQETVALLEHSLAAEEKLLELGGALVDADQIPRSDLATIQARVAATRGSVAQARLGVRQARLALAGAMGIAVEGLADAPLASDSFPPLPELSAIDALGSGDLAAVAIANRADLASTAQLRSAAEVLAAAAKADLRRRVDVKFVAGYSGLHEGGSLARWNDYWTATGHSLFGYQAGPSAAITLDFSWPFKNSTARGRWAQARAAVSAAEIQSANLQRLVGASTTRLTGSLRRAARQVAEAQAAVTYYQESLAGQTEKFTLGEATAIDTLLTEDSLVSQRLALVSAQRAFAELLTRLRFETGTLVDTTIENGKVVLGGTRQSGLEFPARARN